LSITPKVQRCAIHPYSYVASYNQTMAILQLGFRLCLLNSFLFV
jgi:hypothetical protein